MPEPDRSRRWSPALLYGAALAHARHLRPDHPESADLIAELARRLRAAEICERCGGDGSMVHVPAGLESRREIPCRLCGGVAWPPEPEP